MGRAVSTLTPTVCILAALAIMSPVAHQSPDARQSPDACQSPGARQSSGARQFPVALPTWTLLTSFDNSDFGVVILTHNGGAITKRTSTQSPCSKIKSLVFPPSTILHISGARADSPPPLIAMLPITHASANSCLEARKARKLTERTIKKIMANVEKASDVRRDATVGQCRAAIQFGVGSKEHCVATEFCKDSDTDWRDLVAQATAAKADCVTARERDDAARITALRSALKAAGFNESNFAVFAALQKAGEKLAAAATQEPAASEALPATEAPADEESSATEAPANEEPSAAETLAAAAEEAPAAEKMPVSEEESAASEKESSAAAEEESSTAAEEESSAAAASEESATVKEESPKTPKVSEVRTPAQKEALQALGEYYFSQDPGGSRSALHCATKAKCAELIIAAGADVNKRDARDCTPLHSAARVSRTDVMKVLIKHGADVNAKTESGLTALRLLPVQPQREEAFIALIESGADVNARDAFGDTILHSFAKTGFASKRLLKLVVEAGADLCAQDKHGNTPLHTATVYLSDFTFKKVAELFVGDGAPLLITNKSGHTPLTLRKDYERKTALLTKLAHQKGVTSSPEVIRIQNALRELRAAVGALAAGADKEKEA